MPQNRNRLLLGARAMINESQQAQVCARTPQPEARGWWWRVGHRARLHPPLCSSASPPYTDCATLRRLLQKYGMVWKRRIYGHIYSFMRRLRMNNFIRSTSNVDSLISHIICILKHGNMTHNTLSLKHENLKTTKCQFKVLDHTTSTRALKTPFGLKTIIKKENRCNNKLQTKLDFLNTRSKIK